MRNVRRPYRWDFAAGSPEGVRAENVRRLCVYMQIICGVDACRHRLVRVTRRRLRISSIAYDRKTARTTLRTTYAAQHRPWTESPPRTGVITTTSDERLWSITHNAIFVLEVNFQLFSPRILLRRERTAAIRDTGGWTSGGARVGRALRSRRRLWWRRRVRV